MVYAKVLCLHTLKCDGPRNHRRNKRTMDYDVNSFLYKQKMNMPKEKTNTNFEKGESSENIASLSHLNSECFKKINVSQ